MERAMDSDTIWAGIDLGLRQTHVCLLDKTGATIHEQTCETTAQAIFDALSAVPKDRIDLIAAEAGSDTHVVRKLREADFPIVLFESRKASKFLAVRRSKTDAGDARGLADLGRLGRHTVSQVHLKSIECEQLRSQLVMRQRLVRLRVAAEGTLRSRLALYGRQFKKPHAPGLLRERVLAQIAQLKTEEGIDLADDLKPLLDVCETLRRYLQKLDRNLEKLAAEHPVCRRLMKVFGVGTICSLSFFTAIEDPTRFSRAADVAAYLGLTPRRYQSGEVSYTRGITKTGSKMTRTHLVNAAMVFSTRGPDSELKTWAGALKERIGPMRARVALARKLSILLLTIWKNECDFEPYPSKGSMMRTSQAMQNRAGRTTILC
jgi:transposase